MNLHALRFLESTPVTDVSVTVESTTIKAGETTQATAAVAPAGADDTAGDLEFSSGRGGRHGGR